MSKSRGHQNNGDSFHENWESFCSRQVKVAKEMSAVEKGRRLQKAGDEKGGTDRSPAVNLKKLRRNRTRVAQPGDA